MNVCLCISLSLGVKLAAVASILLGIGVTLVGSYSLHNARHQLGNNPILPLANDLIHQVNAFFQGTTGLYDLDKIYRILVYCSITAIIGGVLQFFLSFFLILSFGRLSFAKWWVALQIPCMLGIGGSFFCIITNELEISTAVELFLIITGLDFLVSIYSIWAVYAYICQESYEENHVKPYHVKT